MKILQEISCFERSLVELGTPERAAGEKKYLKSDLDFLGVPVPAIRRLVRDWLREHTALSRDDLVRLARALWKRRYHELRGVAITLLQQRSELLELEDLGLVEWMLRRSKTWAYVDALAVHVVGDLVERQPRVIEVLDCWARDEDFWIRRSALLALLKPLRHGEGDWERFVRYADSMLEEKEFFIRKAIGWILREISKENPGRVHAFLASRTDRVSGLTLREGAKYLPPRQREALVSTYQRR